MGDSQGIIGFTEAELGFFLALLCVVLWVASIPSKAETQLVRINPDSLATLRSAAASAVSSKHRADSVEEVLAAANNTVDSLRSRLLPHCAAIGRASGPVATVEVHTGSKLIVGSKPTTMEEFRSQTEEMRKTVELVCMHQIVVRFSDGLTARQSEAVRSQLNGMRFRILSGSFITQER